MPTASVDRVIVENMLSAHALWLAAGADVTITGRADFSNMNLRGVNLSHRILSYALFRNTNLRGANLYAATLISADFTDADLRRADMRRTNLEHTILANANLRGADMRSVSFCGAMLDGSKFHTRQLGGHGRILCALTDAEWQSIHAARRAMEDGTAVKESNTMQRAWYHRGYLDALTDYAWWKDGEQYVGNCGTTLREAMRRAIVEHQQ